MGIGGFCAVHVMNFVENDGLWLPLPLLPIVGGLVGLGVAMAQPDSNVIVLTGDGEMLMGIGSLATIGVQKPANLSVIVLDNGHFGETGMQASHTNSCVDLAKIAKSSGFN